MNVDCMTTNIDADRIVEGLIDRPMSIGYNALTYTGYAIDDAIGVICPVLLSVSVLTDRHVATQREPGLWSASGWPIGVCGMARFDQSVAPAARLSELLARNSWRVASPDTYQDGDQYSTMRPLRRSGCG